jgi:hypothetical protein
MSNALIESFLKKWKPKDLKRAEGHDYSQNDYHRILGEYSKKPILNGTNPNSILANPGLYFFIKDTSDEVAKWGGKAPNSSFTSYIEKIVYNEPYGKEFIVYENWRGNYGGPSFQKFREKDLIDFADFYGVNFKKFAIDDEEYNRSFNYPKVWGRADFCLFSNESEAIAMWKDMTSMSKFKNIIHLEKNEFTKTDVATALLDMSAYRDVKVNEEPDNEYIGFEETDEQDALSEVDEFLKSKQLSAAE